ncbi:hypothetical protein ACFFWC_28985 [Plantactinospora siamensis]|uniref:Integral membrane protein n=1 Tax=Plantactinospora siamensis TaxID=555372 RepID=A0ABV6NY16_9ACTN
MRGLTFLRRALRAVATAIALSGALALLTAGPARAGQNASVEVTPSTAEPGTRVNIRADCPDGNNRQATVQSDAFGRVMVRPDNGVLTGSATIPGNKPPGDYQVNLTCSNNNTASTTITVVNMSKPSQGPATGGGGTAGGGTGTLVLAGGIGIVVLGLGFGLYGRRRNGPLPR